MNLSEATILLVDDEPQLLEIFGFWLAAAGCRNLYTAANGEMALAVLKTGSIDLIVTDVRMPIMDGITLVRQLGETTEVVPRVIFISGFGDINQREMYGLGVEAFLAKPLLREDLITVMEKTLADRISLWLTPMEVGPRQSMLIQTDLEPTVEKADQDAFHLGRGGFSFRYAGSTKLGKVAFRCRFPPEEREIVGEGYVRWFSRTDQTVGIEFYFLEATCRSWLSEQITALSPRSFIPSFS
jgi:CheY-like chemotaxis protein